MSNKNVLVIYTGGTIGMYKSDDGALTTFDLDQLASQIPELNQFDVQIDTKSIENPIDSSNMDQKVWIELALLIEKHYDYYNGFVILHGSDTMAYTASALSFMLENLKKPVILTGAQLPIGIGRSDAKENLITSIEIAAQAIVPEVCIYFDYRLFRGNRCIKANAEHFEAFKSPNFIHLAEAGLKINYSPINYHTSEGDLIVHTSMSKEIMSLKLFPNMNKTYIEYLLRLPYKALVIETFGTGNATTDPWFINALNEALKEGKMIVNVSQCMSGNVSQGLYQTSSTLQRLGVVGARDMTFEAALTKLMFLVGLNKGDSAIKKLFTKSLRGEVSH